MLHTAAKHIKPSVVWFCEVLRVTMLGASPTLAEEQQAARAAALAEKCEKAKAKQAKRTRVRDPKPLEQQVDEAMTQYFSGLALSKFGSLGGVFRIVQPIMKFQLVSRSGNPIAQLSDCEMQHGIKFCTGPILHPRFAGPPQNNK